MNKFDPHPLYSGENPNKNSLIIDDGDGNPLKLPIRFVTQKPSDSEGNLRDQTGDAARNMRYAATLNLPKLPKRLTPRLGRCIIVGGAPSIKDHLEEIRELSKDPNNAIFAINWTHTWLIENGIVPDGCAFFEIDAEPDTVLKAAHPETTYFICSHCDQKTFDSLEGYERVLWHSYPNSPGEEEVSNEFFPNADYVGGGISTFTRTISIALYLGYRHFDLFGCDSSFPDEGKTHVDGYETVMKADVDGFYVYARNETTEEVRRFKTLGYLALQVEEFKAYCGANHHTFSLRVHGDSLLQWTHKRMWPDQYEVGF